MDIQPNLNSFQIISISMIMTKGPNNILLQSML